MTDLLILRRREPGRDPDPDTLRWLDTTTTVDVDDTAQRVNRYFVDHPGQVLGQLAMGSSLYGDALVVRGAGDTAAELSAALGRVVAEATAKDLRWSPPITTRW